MTFCSVRPRLCPGCTKPLESMASISSWLSLGTTTASTWAGVTTRPTVYDEVLLLAHQVLVFGQIVQFRSELLVEQGLADVKTRSWERRDGCLELGDARL